MSDQSISGKAVEATKWSLLTQVASKLITPITTIVLAHIMAPEVFGVIALVTMVTSFADLFSDAGFQKYLIQHEYESDTRFILSCNVAFWTNLSISLLLWAIIALFRDQLAVVLGNPSIGMAIAVACASLPLTSIVSVQIAVYQRSFDFRTLFYSRTVSALLILLLSVPLAFVGWGYWSLVWGTIASNFFLAVWLSAQSAWRPSFVYSFLELGRMLSFSSWTLIEALSIWLTNWIGAFILGTMMSTYYVGLYNTSTTAVNAVIAVVTSAVNPVVFATLSRFQFDRARFDRSFYLMQKYLGFVVIPLSVALFAFSDLAVGLGLGEAWMEASTFFGLYALSSAFVVVLGHIASDAYRSLGKPRYSLLAQLGFLLFLVPALFVGAKSGFSVLSVLVPSCRLLGTLIVHFAICRWLMKLSPKRMFFELRWVYFAATLVGAIAFALIRLLKLSLVGQAVLLVLSIVAYFVLCVIFKDLRGTMIELVNRFGFEKLLMRLLPARFRIVLEDGSD